jgi:sec-independent protein translocase protein TatA
MQFFNMGGGEIVLILVVALLIFGPRKLPEMGRAVGKGIREFKQATNAITQEFTGALDEVRQPVADVKDTLSSIQQDLTANPMASHSPGKTCPICSLINPTSNSYCGGCGANLDTRANDDTRQPAD